MRPDEMSRRLELAGGVARAQSLIRVGATREDFRRACRHGAVLRIREGVYSALAASPEVQVAALHGGELACASALRRYGVWILDDEQRTHVWLDAKGRAHEHDDCACIVHRDAGRSAFGVVPVAHALVQVARCLGAEVFFAAFESAWNRGLLDRESRAEVRASLPARFRWLVDIARGDAESGLESILRFRLHRMGIVLRSQVVIRGVGRVDFLLDGRIILEVDGRQNHDGSTMRHKDLRRDAAAAAQGYETLRFDYALVIHHWVVVEAAILGRLARR